MLHFFSSVQISLPHRRNTNKVPAGVIARFESADKLSDEDSQAINHPAKDALIPFQPS